MCHSGETPRYLSRGTFFAVDPFASALLQIFHRVSCLHGCFLKLQNKSQQKQNITIDISLLCSFCFVLSIQCLFPQGCLQQMKTLLRSPPLGMLSVHSSWWVWALCLDLVSQERWTVNAMKMNLHHVTVLMENFFLLIHGKYERGEEYLDVVCLEQGNVVQHCH